MTWFINRPVMLIIVVTGCRTPAENQSTRMVKAEPIAPAKADLPKTAPPAHKAAVSTETVPASRKIEVLEDKYVDGTPKSREEFYVDEDGEQVLHGAATYWWESGKKRLEMHYQNGSEHGHKAAWYSDGEKWSEGDFLDGKEHGLWTVWYPDGKKHHEFRMDHGARHGIERRWHENGQLMMHGDWVRGKQSGFYSFWDPQGKLVREIDYGDLELETTQRSP